MAKNGTDSGDGQKRVESGIQSLIDRAQHFFEREMWDVDLSAVSKVRALGIKTTRVLSLAWQGMVQNDCLTRASAMTYITVLSLVPLLAFGFAVAKGFKLYEKLEQDVIAPMLDELAPPLAAGEAAATDQLGAYQLRDAAEQVLDFVNKTNFEQLGIIGLLVMLLAALKLMTKIEGSFNVIWGIKQSRALVRKITDFVALVVVTPILLVVAMAATSALQNNAVTDFLAVDLHLGPVIQILFKALPLVFVWLGFAFVYMVMPNTKVPFMSALVGGIIGGTIFQIVFILSVKFQIGVANYNKIYAGFAALPIFMVWVYMNWVALLLGGLSAWAHQAEPSYREFKRIRPQTPADREIVAVRALADIAEAFAQNRGPTLVSAVAARCNVPPGVLQDIMAPLVARGLLARTDEDGSQGFLPARQLDDVHVASVLEALRGKHDKTFAAPDGIEDLLTELRADLTQSPHNLTLRDLAKRTGGDAR